jgi:hypothetical protein
MRLATVSASALLYRMTFLQNASGHDFSRAKRATKLCWASAPAIFSAIFDSAAARVGHQGSYAIPETKNLTRSKKMIESPLGKTLPARFLKNLRAFSCTLECSRL